MLAVGCIVVESFSNPGRFSGNSKGSNEKKNREARGEPGCDFSGTTRNEVKGRQPNDRREAGVSGSQIKA